MSREDLAIPLAIIALATSIGLAAVKQADLRQKAVIWSLFALAGLMLCLGFAWHWIKDDLPRVGAVLNELAASRITWFVVGMFLVAALLFRRSEPANPAPIEALHTARDGAVQPDAAMEARIAAVDTRIGQVDGKLREAIHGNAEAMRKETAARFEVIRETAEHASEEAEKKQEASEARLEAEIAAVDARAKDRLDATSDFTIKGIDERLTELETRVATFEEQVRRRFRARDDYQKLILLAGDVTHLSDRLLRADSAYYAPGGAPAEFERGWIGEYATWEGRIKEFWEIAAEWGEPFPALFDIPASEYEHVHGGPPNTLPPRYEHRWRTVSIVTYRHRQVCNRVWDRLFWEAHQRPPP